MSKYDLLEKIAAALGWTEVGYSCYRDDDDGWVAKYTGTSPDGKYENLPNWVDDLEYATELAIHVLDLLNEKTSNHWSIEIGAENVFWHERANDGIIADRGITGRNAESFARLAYMGLALLGGDA